MGTFRRPSVVVALHHHRMPGGVFVGILFKRLLAGLRAEVVRLAVVRRRWLAVVSPHATDGVAVRTGRAEACLVAALVAAAGMLSILYALYAPNP